MTLLLLGSALMLIVAACDSGDDEDNGSEDSNGESTEMTSESDQDTGDEETAVPEDDEDGAAEEDTEEPAGTEDSDTSSGDDATSGEDSDSAEATPGDDVAENGEEAEGTEDAPDESGTPGTDDEEALDPEDAQPGPEEGMFFDLDFEEANELTPFELVEPETVPEGVEFQSIMGLASPEASEEERSEEATTVTFSYAQPAGEDMMQGLPVEFTQTSEMDMTENLPPESEQEEMTIGEREVTQVRIQAETGDEIVAYMWGENEIYYSIAAILGPDLEESELEEMVASVPSAG